MKHLKHQLLVKHPLKNMVAGQEMLNHVIKKCHIKMKDFSFEKYDFQNLER